MNSAGELFQRVISDEIRDIPGAINTSDDEIILRENSRRT